MALHILAKQWPVLNAESCIARQVGQVCVFPSMLDVWSPVNDRGDEPDKKVQLTQVSV